MTCRTRMECGQGRMDRRDAPCKRRAVLLVRSQRLVDGHIEHQEQSCQGGPFRPEHGRRDSVHGTMPTAQFDDRPPTRPGYPMAFQDITPSTTPSVTAKSTSALKAAKMATRRCRLPGLWLHPWCHICQSHDGELLSHVNYELHVHFRGTHSLL